MGSRAGLRADIGPHRKPIYPTLLSALKGQTWSGGSGPSVPARQFGVDDPEGDASCLTLVMRWLEYGLDPSSGEEVIQRRLCLG
jgi:hypothetical protein